MLESSEEAFEGFGFLCSFIANSYRIFGRPWSSRNNDKTMTLRSDSNENIKIPRPKLNKFKNSLSYSGALIWNSVPVEIKSATIINSFVNICLEWIKEDS